MAYTYETKVYTDLNNNDEIVNPYLTSDKGSIKIENGTCTIEAGNISVDGSNKITYYENSNFDSSVYAKSIGNYTAIRTHFRITNIVNEVRKKLTITITSEKEL